MSNFFTRIKTLKILLVSVLLVQCKTSYQQMQGMHPAMPAALQSYKGMEAQPFLAQALRLEKALNYLGSSLSPADAKRLTGLQNSKPDSNTTRTVQKILDPYCLAFIDINPEARVSVLQGPARPVIKQGGWTSFLVKVHNQAGITASLQAESSNAAPLLYISSNEPETAEKNKLTTGQVANRFFEAVLYKNAPLMPRLSGLETEYAVLQIYCKDKGQREADLSFNIGPGTQDIGFRNTLHILFTSKPSVNVRLQVSDDDGSPVMASFVIKDNIERVLNSTPGSSGDYHYTLAREEYRVLSNELRGLYPLPSRRLALTDTYPDFFFQPQIYRGNNETVQLPAGKYEIVFTRGPEYLPQKKLAEIDGKQDSVVLAFTLKRWINMAKLGWYSGDHHIHAAGCSHYESPQEGVGPNDMLRQIEGEDLNLGAVLSWGPGWYHQKQFFTGESSELSTNKTIMRYDVEVSGFPSSHAGHLVLLNMKEDDYPGTTRIEEWPGWTLPVLQWAKKQHALTGYAHSGWGLEPVSETNELPNYVLPKMDGIGANEFIVAVTKNLVDFFSAGDTPAPWELNMWYHSLNCGFRTRISGETDFPCIFDERVGIARSYFKTDTLNFEHYTDAIKAGRSYVSTGSAHIIDFKVNNLEMGTNNSELLLDKAGTIKITAKVAAWLSPVQDEDGKNIASRPLTQSPYWHIERARIAGSRHVPAEIIINGIAVDTVRIPADGKWNEISFDYPLKQSSWIAVRIFPDSHTNPVFVLINRKPILVQKSAAWCLQAVNQCWKMKQQNIRPAERAAAANAYQDARNIYKAFMNEPTPEK